MVVSVKMKIIKIIFYKNKFIDFLCFKGFIPSLADLKGMIIPPLADLKGMIIPPLADLKGMNIPLSLDKKDIIKKNDVPPTRGRESLCLPSPTNVPGTRTRSTQIQSSVLYKCLCCRL